MAFGGGGFPPYMQGRHAEKGGGTQKGQKIRRPPNLQTGGPGYTKGWKNKGPPYLQTGGYPKGWKNKGPPYLQTGGIQSSMQIRGEFGMPSANKGVDPPALWRTHMMPSFSCDSCRIDENVSKIKMYDRGNYVEVGVNR